MIFAVHCLDHPDAVDRRLEYYEAHKAYLAAADVRTIISGPLLAADGETMIGSLFVVEAGNAEQVRRFNRSDPFFAANIWASISIHPFLLRVDNRAPVASDALRD